MSNNKLKTSCKRGFTLIELLVVVLIIGILAAVALPQYKKAVMKSRITQLMVRADALYKAMQVYYLENGKYTSDVRDLDIGIESAGAEYGKTSADTYSHTGIIYNGDAAGVRCAVFKGGTPQVLCTDDDVAITVLMKTGKWYCRSRGGETAMAYKVCQSMAVGELDTSLGFKDWPLN